MVEGFGVELLLYSQILAHAVASVGRDESHDAAELAAVLLWTAIPDLGKRLAGVPPVSEADETRGDSILMKWPRGRYNGRRIVGFRITFALNVLSWNWKPIVGLHCGAFHWGPVRTWWQLEYE